MKYLNSQVYSARCVPVLVQEKSACDCWNTAVAQETLEFRSSATAAAAASIVCGSGQGGPPRPLVRSGAAE